MPHPIYGPPSHELHSVEFILWLPTSTNGGRWRLEARGRSETQRGSLWSVTENWGPLDVEKALQPTDALHHLALVAAQDHPATQNALERSLIGEGWEDVPLPF